MRGTCSAGFARGIAFLLGLLSLVAVAVLDAPSGRADAGLWGIGNWPYTNGVICSVGSTTVPLVSWRLNSTPQPAFLLGAISQTAGVDTGQPPSSTAELDRPLTPSGYGNLTATQLAATAYLVSTCGADPNAARVAEVSATIADEAGAPADQRCLSGGPGAPSRTEADQMWTQAQQLAGPYQVALTSSATSLVLGQPTALRAVVTSALGYPVPDLIVVFSSTADGTTTDSNTDPSGTATASVTVGQLGSLVTAPVLTATVNAPTGLQVSTAPGATPAVYARSATPTQGLVTLPLAPPRTPAVSVTTSTRLAGVGAIVRTSVRVSGLNGHAATITVSVAGPLPATAAGSCAQLTVADWSAAIGTDPTHALVKASVSGSLVGDQLTAGPTITLTDPGCYAADAILITTDTRPPLTVSAPYGVAGADLDIVAVAIQARAGTGGIALITSPQLSVTVSGPSVSGGTVSGTIRGPAPAINGACTTVAWTSTPVAATLQPAAVTGSGTYPLRLAGSLTQVGCYALELSAQLLIGDLGSVNVAVAAGTASSTALLLAPQVQVQARSTWTSTGSAVNAAATVLGAFTQPGTLQSELLWQPVQPLGCQLADWAHATVLNSAVPGPTSGDGTYPVASLTAAKAGCYSLQVRLVLTANSAVTAAAPLAAPGSVFTVADGPPAPRRVITASTDNQSAQLWATLFGFIVAIGVAAGWATSWAWRGREA